MEIYYRNHTSSGDRVRVWNIDWPGDTFEIMTKDSFETLIELTKPFGIKFFEAEDY